MVTIFKDFAETRNPHYITIDQALNRIRSGKSKESIDLVREGKFDKELLPSILWSVSKTKPVTTPKVVSSHRTDESAIEHSGVFILDFDNCNVDLQKEQLKTDPYLYAVWLSPSGKGVKALVKCPQSIENHRLYYTAFLDRYPQLDSTSRNISRVTFESYDPNLWMNPNSLIWDKKLTEEQRNANKEKEANRRGTKVISVAVGMIRASYEGEKHDTLLKAATLLGGYVATGRVDESDAIKVLTEEIKAKNPKDLNSAIQTLKDGLAYGKSRPLHESKKIEKAQQFLRRQDGSYDFLADDSEMTEYELAVINGTLEMGLPTGFNSLNNHWVFKKHHIVWWVGSDNVGKSNVVWYFSVLAARLHGWKIIMHSAENNDGQVRKKLKEFYLGKSLKLADDEELTKAHIFIQEHYKIISNKQMHNLEDFLLKCEILMDEGFDAHLVVAEPWNSFDEKSGDRYGTLIHSMNMLRVFKENYCGVWVADHITSSAARQKDDDGFQLAPTKSDAELGVMKGNKTDDFIVIHRIGNHPFKARETQIHVDKIRDVETGGGRTEKGNPVIIEMNSDYCGYTSDFQDPIKELNRRR
jgi:hypothetical protein